MKMMYFSYSGLHGPVFYVSTRFQIGRRKTRKTRDALFFLVTFLDFGTLVERRFRDNIKNSETRMVIKMINHGGHISDTPTTAAM